MITLLEIAASLSQEHLVNVLAPQPSQIGLVV